MTLASTQLGEETAPAGVCSPLAPTAALAVNWDAADAGVGAAPDPARQAEILNTALGAGQLGRPVFPIIGKAPATQHGFHDAEVDDSAIRLLFENHANATGYGIATSDEFMVLDVDPRHGGTETLAQREEQYGALPCTQEVVTGGQGRHISFRCPPGTNMPSRNNALGPGLDIKASGGYIVGPGSQHPNGNIYRWKNSPETHQIADCPQWILDVMRLARASVVATQAISSAPLSAYAATVATGEEQRIQEAISTIAADCDYDTWLRLGMALHAWNPQRGFALWDAWSRTCPAKYEASGMESRWATFQAGRAGGVTLGTLFELARQHGWRTSTTPAATQPSTCGTADAPSTPAVPVARALVDFYDANRKEYLARNSEGVWLPHGDASFKRLLKGRGVSAIPREREPLSDLEHTLIEVQDRCTVVYAGPLAGWSAGAHETLVGRLLITRAARLVVPAPGQWLNLQRFLETLLADHPAQILVFYGWLKVAIDALMKRLLRPGQALAIAGPRNCGKSLAQKLVTELLGGRYARPYQYMAGRTDFNSDLFSAEHLMLEDDVPSTRLEDRRNFGASIKEITANEGQRLHAKHRDALQLPVFWRLSISLNDEPENLMILPPMDSSLADKLILLKAQVATLPCETETPEGRARCWQTLTAELPAFVAYLLAWQIPDELRSARYGVRHFHHPCLLQALAELAPESKLADLIDGVLFTTNYPTAWVGTAAQLESRLTSSDRFGMDARRLLTFNTAVGVYLARLAVKHPERYQRQHGRDGNRWTIAPPPAQAVVL